MTNLKRIERLKKHWYDFDSYKGDDYREVFATETVYIDHLIGTDCIALNVTDYIPEYVAMCILNDLEAVGVELLATSGYTMTIEEWKYNIDILTGDDYIPF